MIGNAVDNLVGVFSPKAKVARLAAREALGQIEQRGQYAAANTSPSTGSWTPVDSKINTILANSIPTMRARARQLMRDMPAMATGVDRVVDFMVGDGLTLQARVKDPATNKLAKAVNQQVEDAWNFWCDEADESGRLHFNEIQQLAARQECGAEGEYVIIKKRSSQRNRFLPLSLMILESDTINGYGAMPMAGNDVHQGVEYNPGTGQAVAYHFEDYDRWSKPLRVPADQVVVGFRTLRPGQLRGVTPLAPAILLSHQLRDYLEASISTAQKAARWLAFVTSNDPAATMAAFGASASPTYTDTAGNKKYTMEMGHAVVDFLHSGEKVDIANQNMPGDAFGPFVKFMLQTFAATVGVTYELVSGNYYDAKYTAARISRNDMNKSIKVRRSRLVRQLCENVRREFLDWAVVSGKLTLPGYFANPLPYLRSVWIDPGNDLLDPLREGRAENDAMANYTRSPQDVLISKGKDPETVLDEHQEWVEMLEERDLPLPKSSPGGLKTNPAEVAPGTGDGTGTQGGSNATKK
jgi:lambda family phage portal protein